MRARLGILAAISLGMASFNAWQFASINHASHAGLAVFCFGMFLFCLVGVAVTGET